MSDSTSTSRPSSTTPTPTTNPLPPPLEGPAVAPPAPASLPAGTSAASSSSTAPASGPAPTSGPASAPGPAGPAPKPPLAPLTGFRAALEHTGLPRGVLTYKPKLPSRKWLVFWSVLGTVSYIYYDDRRRAKNIKEEYIRKVQHYAREPVPGGSLGMVRTVKVLAARWPEDDDADAGGRYFRKYIKPYLVAAAIDYEPLPPPLYGAIARQTHAAILTKRRQKLGLEPTPVPLSVPGALDSSEIEANELAGGVILVGRPSLKEYLEGLKRGWGGGVDEWVWEKEVKGKLQGDGIFEGPPEAAHLSTGSGGREGEGALFGDSASSTPTSPNPTPATASSSSPTGLSFLSRQQTPVSFPPPPPGSSAPAIPSHYHVPPSPLPPQPPLLLVPWTNHLGFQQIPYMIWDFFTEHKRVESGAKLAYALICGHTREFVGASLGSSEPVLSSAPSSSSSSASSGSDLDFDLPAERYIKSDFEDLPTRLEKAKTDYYPDLSARLADIRALAAGERELSDAEKKSTKPLPTEDDLRAERLKREMRWRGQIEGWGIVKKGARPAWEEGWEGWLRVFREPQVGEEQGVGIGSGSGKEVPASVWAQ